MAQQITVTLHELVAAIDNYADEQLRTRFGVSFNLYEVLATVGEQQPIDITGLAHCLRISKAAVSKRVPTLVDEGWLIANPAGGRRIELTLTPKAAELVRTAGGELEHEFTEMFTDPRFDPSRNPQAIPSEALNTHLNTMLEIIQEKDASQ